MSGDLFFGFEELQPGGGGGGDPPLGGDLSGTASAAIIEQIDGQPVTASTATIYADPSGDVLSAGTLPTSPTTLDQALATVPSGGKIVMLGAGVYAIGVPVSTTCTITSAAAQSTPAATAAARISGAVSITARNCHFVGIEFLGGITDSSGLLGAGRTVFEQCSMIGTITITDAATTTIELLASSFADITISGTNSGAVVRALGCETGGTITHATTGPVAVEVRDTDFSTIAMTAAGTLIVELAGVTMSGGITRSAGSVTAITILHSRLLGGIDATGAGAGAVVLLGATYDEGPSILSESQLNNTETTRIAGLLRLADISVTSGVVAGASCNVDLDAATIVTVPTVTAPDSTTKAASTAFATGVAASTVAAHVAALDPHPVYTTTAEAAAAAPVQSVNAATGAVVLTAASVGADSAGTAASAVSTHEGAVDPHPQYTTASEAAAAAPVQSVNALTGAVVLTASSVGAVASSGGTLINGTLAGPVGTSITGTITAAAASVVDLDAAASVVVPTVPWPDNTTAAASTALVTSALTGYATLASPALTGTPTTTTPPAANNSTRIANTTWVQTELGSYLLSATAASTYAPLASPALTGTPTSTTPPGGNNSTRIATTAFVLGELGAYLTSAAAASTYATIASPTFTGTATIPTASITGTATLQSASTLTAVSGAQVTLASATSVTVPTLAFDTATTGSASTAYVVNDRDPSRSARIIEEWVSGNVSGSNGWTSTVSGTAAAVTANGSGLAGSYGRRTFTTGSTATGRAALSFEQTANLAPFLQPWTTATVRLEWRIYIDTLPSVGQDFEWSMSCGVGAGTAAIGVVSGVGVKFDNANANWVLVSRNASADVVTPVVTTLAVATGYNWIILDISSTSAVVYIGVDRAAAVSGGSRGSISTSGATANTVGPMMKLWKIAGVTARTMQVEYTECRIIPTTPR